MKHAEPAVWAGSSHRGSRGVPSPRTVILSAGFVVTPARPYARMKSVWVMLFVPTPFTPRSVMVSPPIVTRVSRAPTPSN